MIRRRSVMGPCGHSKEFTTSSVDASTRVSMLKLMGTSSPSKRSSATSAAAPQQRLGTVLRDEVHRDPHPVLVCTRHFFLLALTTVTMHSQLAYYYLA
jgi:hypothetical protein